MIGLDSQAALDITARLVACGVALSALELIAVRRHFGPGGAFSLSVVTPFRRSFAFLRGVDSCLSLLLIVQATGAALVALIGPFDPAGRFTLLLTIVATMTVRWRRHTGGDGAEQLATLILIATAVAVLPYPSDHRVLAAILFISAQVVLSYATSGVAKLISPVWRDGSALPAVLSTEGHGHPWAVRLLKRHPALALLGSRGIIIFECAFVIILVGPVWLVLVMLLLGATFHVSCAIFMGLNSFVWSFVAAYPCLFFGAMQTRSWLLSL